MQLFPKVTSHGKMQKKTTTIKANKQKTPQSKGKNQAPEGDSDMTPMLELLEQIFKKSKLVC